MKTNQRQQAEELYFQSSLTKTAIANEVGVSRRTITSWAQQGNWDQLRRSVRNMPILIMDKCYHLLNLYVSERLGDYYSAVSITKDQTQVIHQLTSSISRLSKRCSGSEYMQLANSFMEQLTHRAPHLADEARTIVDDMVYDYQPYHEQSFLTSEFDKNGLIPYPFDEVKEGWKDEDEASNPAPPDDPVADTKEPKPDTPPPPIYDEATEQPSAPPPPSPAPEADKEASEESATKKPDIKKISRAIFANFSGSNLPVPDEDLPFKEMLNKHLRILKEKEQQQKNKTSHPGENLL